MKHTGEGSFEQASSRRLNLRRASHAFCPVCAKQVELISFEDAARLFHTDLQDIEYLTNHSGLHQVHNRRGTVMLCSVSLFDCFDTRRTRLLDSGILKKHTAKGSA